jgi:hypothetical protein
MGTSSDVKVSQMYALGECWVSNGLNEHLNGALAGRWLAQQKIL